jgi:alanine racemase
MSASLATRPRWAEVDPDALAANYHALRGLAGTGVDVIASIKANAYGHGAVEVARRLEREGVFALATGSFDEAVAVRRAGIRTPILMFGGALPEAAPDLLRHGLIPTVSDLAWARAVSAAADRSVDVYVEVDAGLGRLGVPLEEAEKLVDSIARLRHLRVVGLYTHLPFVDVSGRDWAVPRLAAFRALAERLGVPVTQALSSAGVIAGLDGTFSAICPGHALYGLPPASPEVADMARFQPVLRAVKTRLIHITHHQAARSGGVGGRWSLDEGAITGVVPFGRHDGYRTPSADAAMLAGGRRAPLLGVSLEHSTLDLSDTPGVAVGDEVVVVGAQGHGRIALEEVASWLGARAGSDVVLGFDRRIPYRYGWASAAAHEDARPAAPLRAKQRTERPVDEPDDYGGTDSRPEARHFESRHDQVRQPQHEGVYEQEGDSE